MNSPTFLRVDKATFYKFISGPHEGRYEYDKGLIVQQMPGATRSHQRLGRRMLDLVSKALDPLKLEVLYEWGVETETSVRFPDLLACAPDGPVDAAATREPALIVEVLSPSTVGTDLDAKPAEYMSLPSLEAYVVLSLHDIAALAWVRGSDRLFPAAPTEYGVGDTIVVPALALAIPLDDIYAGIELSPPETPHGGTGRQPG